eukprot:8220977-Pyramimonas_sp.AAC.1
MVAPPTTLQRRTPRLLRSRAAPPQAGCPRRRLQEPLLQPLLQHRPYASCPACRRGLHGPS